MKKFSLKLIAAMMVVFMLAGVCVPSVFAATDYAVEENETPDADYAAVLVALQDALVILAQAQENIKAYTIEAFENAYNYVLENGYVDAAEAAFDRLVAALPAMLEQIKAVVELLPEEFKAFVQEAVDALLDYLDKAPEIPEVVDPDDELVALLKNVIASLAQAKEMVVAAGVAASDALIAQIERQIDFLENEIIAAIEEAIALQFEKACEYFAVKIFEIYNITAPAQATIAQIVELVRSYVIAAVNEILGAYDFDLDVNVSIEDAIKTVRNILTVAAQVYGIALDAKATLEQFLDDVKEGIKAIFTTGDYVVTDDSYYVAIAGEGYASILADALWLAADQFTTMGWDAIDLAELAKADFITVGYTDGTAADFARSQFFGFVKAYIDGYLREDLSAYVNDAFAFLSSTKLAEVQASLNAALDSAVAEEPFASAELVDLDWAALVGAENVAYVEAARAAIAAKLAEAGVPETFVIPVDVVELLFANTDASLSLKKDGVYTALNGKEIYTVEIPALDFILNAIESALYEKVRYTKVYVETLLYIAENNPEATVVALGAYELFDINFSVLGFEDAVEFDELDEYESVLPFYFAVVSESIHFVDVKDVNTNFEDLVAAFMENGDREEFFMGLLTSDELSAPNAAGCEYIASQILASLTVSCEHTYDDMCTDADCNRCGELREVAGHIFTSYVSNGDATCTEDGTKTAVCDVCGDAEDTIVDEGSMIDHIFTSYVSNGDATCTEDGTKTAVCDICGDVEDTVADVGSKLGHSYASAWSTDENSHWHACSCGDKGSLGAHEDADNDGICDECDYTMSTTPVDPNPPAGDDNNNDNDPPVDGEKDGMSTGAKVAVIASASVAGLVGVFSLGWFGFAKKSWSDFLRLFRK